MNRERAGVCRTVVSLGVVCGRSQFFLDRGGLLGTTQWDCWEAGFPSFEYGWHIHIVCRMNQSMNERTNERTNKRTNERRHRLGKDKCLGVGRKVLEGKARETEGLA